MLGWNPFAKKQGPDPPTAGDQWVDTAEEVPSALSGFDSETYDISPRSRRSRRSRSRYHNKNPRSGFEGSTRGYYTEYYAPPFSEIFLGSPRDKSLDDDDDDDDDDMSEMLPKVTADLRGCAVGAGDMVYETLIANLPKHLLQDLPKLRQLWPKLVAKHRDSVDPDGSLSGNETSCLTPRTIQTNDPLMQVVFKALAENATLKQKPHASRSKPEKVADFDDTTKGSRQSSDEEVEKIYAAIRASMNVAEEQPEDLSQMVSDEEKRSRQSDPEADKQYKDFQGEMPETDKSQKSGRKGDAPEEKRRATPRRRRPDAADPTTIPKAEQQVDTDEAPTIPTKTAEPQAIPEKAVISSSPHQSVSPSLSSQMDSQGRKKYDPPEKRKSSKTRKQKDPFGERTSFSPPRAEHTSTNPFNENLQVVEQAPETAGPGMPCRNPGKKIRPRAIVTSPLDHKPPKKLPPQTQQPADQRQPKQPPEPERLQPQFVQEKSKLNALSSSQKKQEKKFRRKPDSPHRSPSPRRQRRRRLIIQPPLKYDANHESHLDDISSDSLKDRAANPATVCNFESHFSKKRRTQSCSPKRQKRRQIQQILTCGAPTANEQMCPSLMIASQGSGLTQPIPNLASLDSGRTPLMSNLAHQAQAEADCTPNLWELAAIFGANTNAATANVAIAAAIPAIPAIAAVPARAPAPWPGPEAEAVAEFDKLMARRRWPDELQSSNRDDHTTLPLHPKKESRSEEMLRFLNSMKASQQHGHEYESSSDEGQCDMYTTMPDLGYLMNPGNAIKHRSPYKNCEPSAGVKGTAANQPKILGRRGTTSLSQIHQGLGIYPDPVSSRMSKRNRSSASPRVVEAVEVMHLDEHFKTIDIPNYGDQQGVVFAVDRVNRESEGDYDDEEEDEGFTTATSSTSDDGTYSSVTISVPIQEARDRKMQTTTSNACTNKHRGNVTDDTGDTSGLNAAVSLRDNSVGGTSSAWTESSHEEQVGGGNGGQSETTDESSQAGISNPGSQNASQMPDFGMRRVATESVHPISLHDPRSHLSQPNYINNPQHGIPLKEQQQSERNVEEIHNWVLKNSELAPLYLRNHHRNKPPRPEKRKSRDCPPDIRAQNMATIADTDDEAIQGCFSADFTEVLSAECGISGQDDLPALANGAPCQPAVIGLETLSGKFQSAVDNNLVSGMTPQIQGLSEKQILRKNKSLFRSKKLSSMPSDTRGAWVGNPIPIYDEEEEEHRRPHNRKASGVQNRVHFCDDKFGLPTMFGSLKSSNVRDVSSPSYDGFILEGLGSSDHENSPTKQREGKSKRRIYKVKYQQPGSTFNPIPCDALESSRSSRDGFFTDYAPTADGAPRTERRQMSNIEHSSLTATKATTNHCRQFKSPEDPGLKGDSSICAWSDGDSTIEPVCSQDNLGDAFDARGDTKEEVVKSEEKMGPREQVPCHQSAVTKSRPPSSSNELLDIIDEEMQHLDILRSGNAGVLLIRPNINIFHGPVYGANSLTNPGDPLTCDNTANCTDAASEVAPASQVKEVSKNEQKSRTGRWDGDGSPGKLPNTKQHSDIEPEVINVEEVLFESNNDSLSDNLNTSVHGCWPCSPTNDKVIMHSTHEVASTPDKKCGPVQQCHDESSHKNNSSSSSSNNKSHASNRELDQVTSSIARLRQQMEEIDSVLEKALQASTDYAPQNIKEPLEDEDDDGMKDELLKLNTAEQLLREQLELAQKQLAVQERLLSASKRAISPEFDYCSTENEALVNEHPPIDLTALSSEFHSEASDTDNELLPIDVTKRKSSLGNLQFGGVEQKGSLESTGVLVSKKPKEPKKEGEQSMTKHDANLRRPNNSRTRRSDKKKPEKSAEIWIPFHLTEFEQDDGFAEPTFFTCCGSVQGAASLNSIIDGKPERSWQDVLPKIHRDDHNDIGCSGSGARVDARVPKYIESAESSEQHYHTWLSASTQEEETEMDLPDVLILHHQHHEAIELMVLSEEEPSDEESEQIEIIFVEDSFLSSDSFSFGDTKGIVFDWIREGGKSSPKNQPRLKSSSRKGQVLEHQVSRLSKLLRKPRKPRDASVHDLPGTEQKSCSTGKQQNKSSSFSHQNRRKDACGSGSSSQNIAGKARQETVKMEKSHPKHRQPSDKPPQKPASEPRYVNKNISSAHREFGNPPVTQKQIEIISLIELDDAHLQTSTQDPYIQRFRAATNRVKLEPNQTLQSGSDPPGSTVRLATGDKHCGRSCDLLEDSKLGAIEVHLKNGDGGKSKEQDFIDNSCNAVDHLEERVAEIMVPAPSCSFATEHRKESVMECKKESSLSVLSVSSVDENESFMSLTSSDSNVSDEGSDKEESLMSLTLTDHTNSVARSVNSNSALDTVASEDAEQYLKDLLERGKRLIMAARSVPKREIDQNHRRDPLNKLHPVTTVSPPAVITVRNPGNGRLPVTKNALPSWNIDPLKGTTTNSTEREKGVNNSSNVRDLGRQATEQKSGVNNSSNVQDSGHQAMERKKGVGNSSNVWDSVHQATSLSSHMEKVSIGIKHSLMAAESKSHKESSQDSLTSNIDKRLGISSGSSSDEKANGQISCSSLSSTAADTTGRISILVGKPNGQTSVSSLSGPESTGQIFSSSHQPLQKGSPNKATSGNAGFQRRNFLTTRTPSYKQEIQTKVKTKNTPTMDSPKQVGSGGRPSFLKRLMQRRVSKRKEVSELHKELPIDCRASSSSLSTPESFAAASKPKLSVLKSDTHKISRVKEYSPAAETGEGLQIRFSRLTYLANKRRLERVALAKAQTDSLSAGETTEGTNSVSFPDLIHSKKNITQVGGGKKKEIRVMHLSHVPDFPDLLHPALQEAKSPQPASPRTPRGGGKGLMQSLPSHAIIRTVTSGLPGSLLWEAAAWDEKRR